LFAGFAERGQGGKVGLLRVGKADDRRKAARVAARVRGAAGELRVRAAQGFPEDVVEPLVREKRHAAAPACESATLARRTIQ